METVKTGLSEAVYFTPVLGEVEVKRLTPRSVAETEGDTVCYKEEVDAFSKEVRLDFFVIVLYNLQNRLRPSFVCHRKRYFVHSSFYFRCVLSGVSLEESTCLGSG